MRNVADTDAYTTFDHVMSLTLRSLSGLVGVKRITQPFWARWLASGIEEDVLFEFLDGVGTIDNWATVAARVVARKEAEFASVRAGLTRDDEIAGLRRLSYLCHMAQWGCLPITNERRDLYRRTRDHYVAAETLAFGDAFARLDVPWQGRTVHANLHRQLCAAPMIAIVHGIDGTKEEHLATELALVAAGFHVIGLDGPGQAEALLLDDILWTPDFPDAVSAVLSAASTHPGVQVAGFGALGLSIGGMWALRAAAGDSRITAVFDLGGPINTRRFPTLPFLIKTRMCQVTGARTPHEVATVLAQNSIESVAVLDAVDADVRIVHGARDRVVSTADKEWLRDQLARRRPPRDISLRVIEGGDHCCTAHASDVRTDAVAFFRRALMLAE
jgi:alpha-beta hydrolase superfamily lysophospholipase